VLEGEGGEEGAVGCGVLVLTLEPPPRIDGSVLVVVEAVVPSLEEARASGHSFHTQQEKLFPTLASTPVTIINPTTKAIAPATALPLKIERRLTGAREANLEKGCLSA
jgi:hypothetical protein